MVAVIRGLSLVHTWWNKKVYENTLVNHVINSFIIEIERFLKNKPKDIPDSGLYLN